MSDDKKSRGFTAYKSPAVERVLNHRTDASTAGRISEVCDRYWHIVLSTPIPLTNDELAMVADALSGTHIDTLMVDYLHDEIADVTDDIEPHICIPEYVALAEKVAKLSTSEKYAILEKLKR